ncbi:MAG TPA: HAD family hydrolase [Bryobacteraceae bacterium]|jgi:phosphoglycolate phosphatase-like HAD superfamily hydrolase|nr:HAD family hydrolase [Bryobacteraceae bacterium]
MNAATVLVLFDIDGTLLRGAGAHHKQALIDGIQKVTGLATHLDGIATSGMLDCDLIAAMLKAAGHPEREIRAVMRQVMEECQSCYRASCPSDLRPQLCPGVPALLSALRERGAELGLVTGNLTGIAWRKMELAGLRDYFSVGGFAEDAGTRAELAQVARQRAIERGLVAPDCRTSLVGDHPNDVLAAKANGFRAVAVGTGLVGCEDLAAAQPDVLAPNLEQLAIEKLL